MVKVKEKVKEFSLLVSSVSSSSLSKRRAVVTHLHIIRTSLIEPELGLASFFLDSESTSADEIGHCER